MNALSIFTLLRLSYTDDSEAVGELKGRYIRYRDSIVDSREVTEEDGVGIRDAFYSALSGDPSLLTDAMDGFEDRYNEIKIARILHPEQVSDASMVAPVNRMIAALLKDGKCFSTIYFALFLGHLLPSDTVQEEVKQLARYYMHSKYFALHAVNLMKDDPEFLRLHHTVYYQCIGFQESNLDFYFDFPGEKENSLFFLAQHLSPAKMAEKLQPEEHSEEKTFHDDFIALMRKHNRELIGYDEVASCVSDADAFFRKNGNAKRAIETMIDELNVRFDAYPHIVNFIMTLLTRCHETETFQFAIGATRIFNFLRRNRRLYDFLEKMAQYPGLVQYSLYALQSHPHFQTICYRIAQNNPGYVETQAIPLLDLHVKKNLRMIRKKLQNSFLRQMMGFELLTRWNLKMLLLEDTCPEDLAWIVVSLLIGVLSNTSFGELKEVEDAQEMVEVLYRKFVSGGKVSSPHLNTLLLIYSDLISESDRDLSKKIQDIVSEYVVYEDEISYIDEALMTGSFDVEELSLMMEYYEYCPENRVRELFLSDPKRYLRFLMPLSVFSTEEEKMDNCLRALDELLEIPQEHLNVQLDGDSVHADEMFMYEYLQMLMVSEVLSEAPGYYPNLYRTGISYCFKDIRQAFYQNLVKVNRQTPVDDPELFGIIEENYAKETSEEILSLMEQLLGMTRVEVS